MSLSMTYAFRDTPIRPACVPAAWVIRFVPACMAVFTVRDFSNPDWASADLLSVAPAIAEQGRSQYRITCAHIAVARACSPDPPEKPPVRKSVIMGLGPAITFASGSIQWAYTTPANASAKVCATEPAVVTGLDAPNWPKTLACTGKPFCIATFITAKLSAWNLKGGTAWLMLNDTKG